MRRGYRDGAGASASRCTKSAPPSVQGAVAARRRLGSAGRGFPFPERRARQPDRCYPGARQGCAAGAAARIFETVAGHSHHRSSDGRVTGVVTERGAVSPKSSSTAPACGRVRSADSAGVNVPLQAAEHYYLISEPVAGVHPMLPILRDPGDSAYIREEAGKIMVGIFETVREALGVPRIPAGLLLRRNPARLGPHVSVHRAGDEARSDACLDTGIKLLFCGPESFTPDHNYLMGEAPNLRNFFVAAGFNSLGILSGGGVGFVMAHWIATRPRADGCLVGQHPAHSRLAEQRPLPRRSRSSRSLGIGYQDHWPFRQWETARNVKKSVLHDRLAAAGACFGESAGWERPELVRGGRAAAGLPVRLGPAELVREQRRGAPRGARARRPLRAVLVREVAGAGARCRGGAQSHRDRRLSMCRSARVSTRSSSTIRGGIEADLTITRLASRPISGRDRRLYADACRGLDPAITRPEAATAS